MRSPLEHLPPSLLLLGHPGKSPLSDKDPRLDSGPHIVPSRMLLENMMKLNNTKEFLRKNFDGKGSLLFLSKKFKHQPTDLSASELKRSVSGTV